MLCRIVILVLVFMLYACDTANKDTQEDAQAVAPETTEIKAPALAKIIPYTKIDEAGKNLPDNAVAWSCVRDNATGLVWENKTDDGGLRDKDWFYTWCDEDPKLNAGFVGLCDTGVQTSNLSDPAIMKKVSQGFYMSNSETNYYIDPKGVDACFDKSRCDSTKFVEDVNKAGLCGANDWRLPKLEELKTIVNKDYKDPVINTHYFPNTVIQYYWAAEAFEDDNLHAWSIGFRAGDKYWTNKANQYVAVRLVRSEKPVAKQAPH